MVFKDKRIAIIFISLFLIVGSAYAQKPEEEYYNKGREYQRLNRNEEAIVEFNEAIRINPKYAEAYDAIGWSYLSIGQIEKGMSYLMKNVEINPDYAPAYVSLALIQYNDGKGDLQKTKGFLLKAKQLYENQGNNEGIQEVEQFLNKIH